MITIYLAHALSGAPERFLKRMEALRNSIGNLRGVEVLRFAWRNGSPDLSVGNIYRYDIDRAQRANLLVAVLDHPSFGAGMEIVKRCESGNPMALFHPNYMKVPTIITDCIRAHREAFHLKGRPFAEENMIHPIPYYADDEIIHYVADWAKAHSDDSAIAIQ